MKKLLSMEELDSQVALELPDREMMALINLVLITGDIRILNLRNVDVEVALNICAVLLAAGVAQQCTATA